MAGEEKYYTLIGMDKVYTDYKFADAAKKSMEIKGDSDYPVPFSTEDDAEAFRQGKWDTYLKEHYARYQTDADAIIYADGSVDTDKECPTGGYGIIIFFKSGEIICESAQLEDKENGKLLSKRYDMDGNLTEEKLLEYPVIPGAKEGFVKSGNNEAGEPEGARRALELCFGERGTKKVVLVYDSKTIKERYINGTTFKTTKPEHPANFYGEFCEKIKKEYGDDAVSFIHVESHRGKAKGKKKAEPPYRIDEMEFLHAVFNDLVDAMAKAEAGIGIVDRKENINLVHIIPERQFKVETRKKLCREHNKAEIRELLQLVLQKEWFRPMFTE